MRRENLLAIVSAVLSESDVATLREISGLVFWRERELRAAFVREFKVGQEIDFIAPDGKSQHRGTIAKINQFSVSVHEQRPEGGYTAIVVPAHRILTPPPSDPYAPRNE